MSRVIQVNSRQLRMLVALMLLLPLLPIGIMARFMLHTVDQDRAEAVDSITRVFQSQLHRVSGFVNAQIGEGAFGATTDPGTLAPRIIEKYESVFSGVEGIRIVDAAGYPLATSGWTKGEASVYGPVSDRIPGVRVELFGVSKEFALEIGPLLDLRALLTPMAVTAVVFLVTALVAWTVTRQLKMEELKTDFLATVGHELKTPLASSRVLIETLADGNAGDAKTKREYYGLLLRENERLGGLVESFLKFQRLVQRKSAMAKEEIDPVALAEDAVAGMRPKAREAGGDLKLRHAGEIGTVVGDRGALTTVVTNLIDNALKYSDDAPEIEVTMAGWDSGVEFRVLDRGMGIPREAASRVFDQFYQVDERLSRSRGGCGLGLSIAKQIVLSHGGDIRVKPRKGGGSCFAFHLPRTGAA